VIDQRELGAPVVGEAAEMRNDEVDVRVFLSEQLANGHLAADIVKHRQRESPRRSANLAGNRGIVPVDFNADEAVTFDGGLDQFMYAPPVALRMHESKSVEPAGPTGDNARHLPVGDGVVRMECGEQHRPAYACRRRAAQIVFQRRFGIPRSGQAVAGSGMAVAIDDHAVSPIGN